MAAALYFTPELHLKDGRIIRHIGDALSFAREQEARPGVDQRDEVLHKMERAQNREEAHAAAHFCAGWKSWTCWNEDHPRNRSGGSGNDRRPGQTAKHEHAR
jgi:hypothetical protein